MKRSYALLAAALLAACDSAPPEPPPNRAPVAEAVLDMVMYKGDQAAIDADTLFNDPDGGTLRYTAAVATGSVSVEVVKTHVTVRAVAPGVDSVTITASDDSLEASLSFQVTVPNRPPEIIRQFEDEVIGLTETTEVIGNDYFADPDGDTLLFNARSSDEAVAEASVSSDTITVVPIAEGTTRIEVTAADTDTSEAVTQNFELRVERTTRDVLVTLYEATGGENWFFQDNWLSDRPWQEWYGMVFDDGELYVRLAGNNLSGSLPEGWLGHLPENTVSLQLNRNLLGGAVPADIANLPNLRGLGVGVNHTGQIPDEIAAMPSLESFFGPHNQFSGPIPNGFVRDSLQYLNLLSNELVGEIPVGFGKLPVFRVLLLSENQLTGEIPADIWESALIANLQLADNKLTGKMPLSIARMSNLETLWVEHNELTGEIPQLPDNPSSLRDIGFGNTAMTGALPSQLGDADRLRTLSVDSAGFEGTVPESFLGLERLIYFHWGGNSGGLCMPDTEAFREWRNEIEEWDGPMCDDDED